MGYIIRFAFAFLLAICVSAVAATNVTYTIYECNLSPNFTPPSIPVTYTFHELSWKPALTVPEYGERYKFPEQKINFTPPKEGSIFPEKAPLSISFPELKWSPPSLAGIYTKVEIELNLTPPPIPSYKIPTIRFDYQPPSVSDKYTHLFEMKLRFRPLSLASIYTFFEVPGIPVVCGDGVCDPGESYQTCRIDCPPVCGNDRCEEPDESPQNCPQDCPCGDGICQPEKGEDYYTCRIDCPPVCGNDRCEEPDESPQNCPQDCPCGDGICQPEKGEDYYTCRIDCPPVCGNNICESPDEAWENCPQDCKCGDGICQPERGESYSTCRIDCPPVCGNNICESPDESPQNCPQDCPLELRLDGRIVGDVRFDKDKYEAGDEVVASISIQNTGTKEITRERITVRATCMRLDDWRANRALKGMTEEERSETYTMELFERISPGETKSLSARFKTKKEMETKIGKISLSGDYKVSVTISIDGKVIGSREVKLTLY